MRPMREKPSCRRSKACGGCHAGSDLLSVGGGGAGGRGRLCKSTTAILDGVNFFCCLLRSHELLPTHPAVRIRPGPRNRACGHLLLDGHDAARCLRSGEGCPGSSPSTRCAWDDASCTQHRSRMRSGSRKSWKKRGARPRPRQDESRVSEMWQEERQEESGVSSVALVHGVRLTSPFSRLGNH